MLGLTFDKIVILAVIAAFLLGPTRLPIAAAALGKFVRSLRAFTTDTTERIRQEVGPEFDEIDWQRLDPRQYDPRRIIRDALTSEPDASPVIGPPFHTAATGSDATSAAETPASEGSTSVSSGRAVEAE
jgi:sec-independent protein translocase protein TatB